MMKHIFLASAMIISAPVLARTMPAQNGDQSTTAPTTAVPQSAPASPGTPPAPVDPSTAQPSPAPQTAPATPDSQAAAQPQATGDQVAMVVNQEFPTYDKNSDGSLNKTEFSDWMLALKTAADPSTKATDPATKTWMTQAFTQADTDKSMTVSKTELTAFLAQASKAS